MQTKEEDFLSDFRFQGIEPFPKTVYLSSPTMHRSEGADGYAELSYVRQAFDTNWLSCVGENVDKCEELAASYTGMPHAVALSSGTAAIHLAVKLAAEKVYGSATGVKEPDGRKGNGGALYGKKVFCSDLTFDAAANPIVYEGGEPVFIDADYATWNMDPEALEKAFSLHPNVRIVILSHLYGTPARIEEIREICDRHDALLIEDAAESLGAARKGRQTGSYGDYGILSFNGNKIITGSSGGMMLTHDAYSAEKARKWSTQSREAAPWYEHEELGYNYRMSNLIAGVVRGQWAYLAEHIAQKRAVYERYREGLQDLPVTFNPTETADSTCNYWLSCLLIDEDAMAKEERTSRTATYAHETGKSCPMEIHDALKAFHAEARPVWKPMHLQPIYASNAFVTAKEGTEGVSTDLFTRGLCLPSDNKMTPEEQERIIAIIRGCFG